MTKSRFTEEQIAFALRLAEGGTPVADVWRQIGISGASFYTWKKKYADLGVSELRKLKMLGDPSGINMGWPGAYGGSTWPRPRSRRS